MARRTATAHVAPKAPSRESSAKLVSRLRRDESGERVSVYLPPDMATELRVRCARERRSVSDGVTEAIGAWLASESR